MGLNTLTIQHTKYDNEHIKNTEMRYATFLLLCFLHSAIYAQHLSKEETPFEVLEYMKDNFPSVDYKDCKIEYVSYKYIISITFISKKKERCLTMIKERNKYIAQKLETKISSKEIPKAVKVYVRNNYKKNKIVDVQIVKHYLTMYREPIDNTWYILKFELDDTYETVTLDEDGHVIPELLSI